MQVRAYVTALRVQGAAPIACAEGTMKSKRAYLSDEVLEQESP